MLDVLEGEGSLDEDSSVFPVRVEAPERGEDFFPPSEVLRNRTLEDLGMTGVLEVVVVTVLSPSSDVMICCTLLFAGELVGVMILSPVQRGSFGVDGSSRLTEISDIFGVDGSPSLTGGSGMIWEEDGVSLSTSFSDPSLTRMLLLTQVFLLLFKGSTSAVVPPDGLSVARQMLMATNSVMRMCFIVCVWG